jgi:hypothetical protein
MDGQRKALIVANDVYEHEGLRHLLAPAADAEALAGVLGDAQIGDFDVRVVHNEPAHEIEAQIEDLFADSRPDDVLLLHFSCHGLKSESGDLFFAARNTRPNRLGSTAVSADFVQRCMRASRSRSIVLLLDCCYGGAFGQGVAVRAAGDVNVLDSFPGGKLGGGRGRAVITASNSMEYAFEGDTLADDHSQRPSIFTTALVDGLATGEADRDEDGWVSLNELYNFVFDRVREQTPHQTPSRDIQMQGELYIARSGRRRIRPAPIPADLKAATTDPNIYTRVGAVAELRGRLTNPDPAIALGAREALTEIARMDIKYVADLAADALEQITNAAEDMANGWPDVTLEATPDAATPRDDPEAIVTAAADPSARTDSDDGQPMGDTSATQPPAAGDRQTVLTAISAIAGALLITVATFLAYYRDEPATYFVGLAEFTLSTAVIVVVADILLFVRRTRALIGPGVMLGAAAAVSAGLVVNVAFFNSTGGEGFNIGFWLMTIGFLILVAATVLPGLATIRSGTVSFRGSVRTGWRAWLVTILTALAALFLMMRGSGDERWGLGFYGAGTTWLAITALIIAISAPIAMPRSFAVALLAGWLASGVAALVRFGSIESGWRFDPLLPTVLFSLTLVALLVATILFARGSAGHPQPDAGQREQSGT